MKQNTKKQSTIKLYVKPVEGKPFAEWPYIWLIDSEIKEYTDEGYIRVKNLKKKGY